MTRPTDEQIKALRKGDVVTVRAVVAAREDRQGDLLLEFPYAGGGHTNSTYASKDCVVSIESREIKVGDRVYYSNVPHDVGTVRHVEAGRAAIMFDSGVFSAYNLETLRVIP